MSSSRWVGCGRGWSMPRMCRQHLPALGTREEAAEEQGSAFLGSEWGCGVKAEMQKP